MAKTEEAERDYTAAVDKPISELQQHLHDWLLDKTEYDPAKAKTKAEAFLMGVKLTVQLRMQHQASPENQERQAAAEAAREEREAAKAEKPKGKSKPKAKAEEAEEVEEAEEAKPAKKTAAKAPAKKATPKKASAKGKSADVPF